MPVFAEHEGRSIYRSMLAMLLFFFTAALLPVTPLHAASDGTDAFLKRHWAQPIQPQGKAPKSFSALESSLEPSACGSCHTGQYRDWRTSLHAHAMGPGIMGQLLTVRPDATEELRACTVCHAPLAEQIASLKKQLRGKQQNEALHEQGLICAACHVRRHQRYGPPPNKPVSKGSKPHGGFTANAAFADGRFCATCHQFGADGYALNGKPLENTYAEWQASPYAAQGRQCQSCHMPQRRHLWRGIHDAATTRQGVTIESNKPIFRNGKLSAQLTLTNSGTGHYFPTYVTPRITVQIFQTSADQKIIKDTLQEKIVARQVSLDLTEELADTRLAPGRQVTLDYLATRHPKARAMVFRVHVEPDYFYSGLYRSLLEQPENRGIRLIRNALRNSLDSAYDLYVQNYSLTQ